MKDSAPGFTLLKLTTDGHRESCGLSATAELLVESTMGMGQTDRWTDEV